MGCRGKQLKKMCEINDSFRRFPPKPLTLSSRRHQEHLVQGTFRSDGGRWSLSRTSLTPWPASSYPPPAPSRGVDNDGGQPRGGDEVRGPGGQGPGPEQQVHPRPDGGHRDGLLGGHSQPAGTGAEGRRNQGHRREISGLSVCLEQTNLNLCVVICRVSD